MRAIACIAALALAGCNLVFGLDPPVVRDGASDGASDGAVADGDDTPIDAHPDAAPCMTGNLTIAAEADTLLANNGSGVVFGGFPLVNVGVGIDSVGLWRFDLGLLPPQARIVTAQLRLFYLPTSNQCGNGCGSCASIDMSGTVSLTFARSDWEENAATWSVRGVAGPWAAPGASGGQDRSGVIGTAIHAADQHTVIDFDPFAIDQWRAGTKISFRAAPGPGAVLIIAARENTTAEACLPADIPANLSLDYCVP